jgi:HAD superfamily hydrolase (TIGR01509 family)
VQIKNSRGALWDMDGVLVDTGEFHYQSWSQILPQYGIPFDRDRFQATFGMNNAGVIATLSGEKPGQAQVEEIGGRKETLFREIIRGQVQPLPGVLDWLQRLQSWGFRQAMASSAPVANIDALVDELGLRPYFSTIVSGAALPSKPDPTVFLQAASAIDVSPEQCLVFEDAVAGVGAARRAGMRCIAVTTTNPAAALRDADLVVERLDRLTETAFWSVLDF